MEAARAAMRTSEGVEEWRQRRKTEWRVDN